MSYKLSPGPDSVVIVELDKEEIRELLDNRLLSLESHEVNVLQYGRVIGVPIANDYPGIKAGLVVLYAGIAADRTNFGSPRQLIVPYDQIKATLVEE